MKEKIFSMLQKENNPVCAIIEMFKKQKWIFKVNKEPFFSNYELPDIILSKDLIKLQHCEGDCIELMGCYRYKNGNQNEEGEIVLYYNKIYSVAEKYCSQNNNTDINKVVLDLTEIVFVHECIHWIIHWIESPTYGIASCLNNKFIPLEYDFSKMDTVEFHEAFAQLFTYFYLEWQADKKKIFDWLLKGQPYQYLKFEDVLKLGIKSSHDAIKLLSFMRLFNYQSFDEIKKCIICTQELKYPLYHTYLLSYGGFLKILTHLTHNEIIEKLIDEVWSDARTQSFAFRGLSKDEAKLLAEKIQPYNKENKSIQEVLTIINDQDSHEQVARGFELGFY